MSIITLDFETPYGKGARADHILHKYSLRSMTYEQYIRDPRFKVFGCGIKIDQGPSVYYSNEQPHVYFNDMSSPQTQTLEEVLREIFYEGNDHTVIAHNMLFDGSILSWYYGLKAKTYWCTQAMSRGLWNQRSSSLKQLCINCYPDDKNIRKGEELADFKNIYDLDEEQDKVMADYCNNDVEITWECMKQLWKWVPDSELALIDMTIKMHTHPAFVLDTPIVEEFLNAYNTETDEIIKASGVSRSTLASPAKFANWVQENLGLEIPVIDSPTETNPDNTKFALGKDEMEFVNFQVDHHEHQPIWDARLRVASTLDRTRAERMLEHGAVCDLNPEGRISTPLNYAAAHTLRWGGTNKINFQNLRRGSTLRKALRAPENYSVIVADLSNIEGRMNAWFCKEPHMLRSFAEDRDIYCEFASDVYKRPITKEDEIERFLGKTCVLGLGYQTGPAKLRNTLYLQSQKKVNLPLDTCKTIVYDLYRGKYTQIVKGWDDALYAINKMHTLGHDETMPWRCLIVEKGRIRLPGDMYLNYPDLKVELDEMDRPQYSYWNGKYRTKIYGGKLIENLIQALARKVLAQMMIDINDWLLASRSRYGAEARVALTVHDEIIAIGLTTFADEIFNKMQEFMSVVPDWCNDGTLTLKAEGGHDLCYSK